MTRLGRIVVVTIGLVCAGLIFGALAGGASITLVSILAGEDISGDLFEYGAWLGAPLGAITAPLVSWLLLRRVPIGRMFLACSLATIIGGALGWFTPISGDIVLRSLFGALIGCVVAAVALRYRVQQA